MQGFREWLLEEERSFVDPEVLASWERGFQDELNRLIARTRNFDLRSKFAQMRDCPVQDATRRCRSFVEYILGALIRHGVQREYDMDAAIAYVYQNMMSPTTERGTAKSTLFGGFDETRPEALQGNPLEARFKRSVGNLVRNIASGRVPRLRRVQRPERTLSIGRATSGEIAPDAIPARGEVGGTDLMSDLETLLRRRQRLYPAIPLVDLFKSILQGDGTRFQRAKFGHNIADEGRRIIVQTIRDYARETDNYRLLYLLKTLDAPTPKRSTPQQPAKQFTSPTERDYASIAGAIERLGGRATTSDLGRLRRKWLNYAPRDDDSPHPHRLADVLYGMVRDDVLSTEKTRRGGMVYVPGGRFSQYVGSS